MFLGSTKYTTQSRQTRNFPKFKLSSQVCLFRPISQIFLHSLPNSPNGLNLLIPAKIKNLLNVLLKCKKISKNLNVNLILFHFGML